MKNKNTAGILALFFGGLGVHKFYLGKNIEAGLYLIFSFTLIPILFGIVEGICYLQMSNEKFDILYNNENNYYKRTDRDKSSSYINSSIRAIIILGASAGILISNADIKGIITATIIVVFILFFLKYYILRQDLKQSIKENKLNITEYGRNLEKLEVEYNDKIEVLHTEYNDKIEVLHTKYNEKIRDLKNKVLEHMGLDKSQYLNESQIAFFKEYEINRAINRHYNKGLRDVLIRNNGMFLSILKTDFIYSYKNNLEINLSNENYNFEDYEDFQIIRDEVMKFTSNYKISDFSKAYNFIKKCEDILYSYKIFKEKYYPEIRPDIDLLQRVEEAKAYELQKEAENEMTEARLSRNIPQNIKNMVWKRDEGKCVECGSNEFLEFDHIVPFSKGGANTVRNLQLLCSKCNKKKSNKIG